MAWLARYRVHLFVVATVVVALLLRVSFPGDIEYKFDEKWMFEAALKVRAGGPWPWVGMQSGAGLLNPGLSVWVFVALSWLLRVDDPTQLARGVQLLNVAAVALVALYGWKKVKPPERDVWLWAAALVAVNPVAVIYHRKIWAQCVLPLFCTAFLIAWLNRGKRWGAFTWGLLGALLGQVHMSGFFLAAAFAAGTWLPPTRKNARFLPWLVGSALGALPLVPWVKAVLTEKRPPGASTLAEVFRGTFFGYWVLDPLGLDLATFLGKSNYWRFWSFPASTYLCCMALAGVVVCGLVMLRYGYSAVFPLGGDSARGVRFALLAGLLMTLSGVLVHRHYLIVTFPFEWLWLAGIGLAGGVRGRRALAVLWVLQLLLSVALLCYLHVNGGAPGGDYGVSYQRQAHAPAGGY